MHPDIMAYNVTFVGDTSDGSGPPPWRQA